MPRLAWRTDADGFAFANEWTFDQAERITLTALVQPIAAAAVASVAAILPDPILITVLTIAAQGYIAIGPLPTYGLCGGMSYSALDHWYARALLPRGANDSDQPARTGPTSAAVRDMVWSRLLDSLGRGGVLQRTIEWSLLLNQVPTWLGGGAPELLARTRQEWIIIKGHIDAGRPWPLGLVYTTRGLWDQHQVVAYSYTDNNDGTGSLLVYDCNAPHQYGDPTDSEITLDFTGRALIAMTPSDTLGVDTLAGFFCSNYASVAPPPGLAMSFGQFLSWSADPRIWMVVDGARLPLAGLTELASLGAVPGDIRPTGVTAPAGISRPRDGALLRERSAAPVFLYQGGAPFLIPDPSWLERFGGGSAVQTVPDGTLATFSGSPANKTLLREWSDPKVYMMDSGQRRWVTTPAELSKYGGFQTVRLVPDNALTAIPQGQILPPPKPNECLLLRSQLNKLEAQIVKLEEEIGDASTDIQEHKLETALAHARRQKAEAEARIQVLQCL